MIELNQEEKNLIVSAIKFEKKILERTDDEIEYVEEIEKEMDRENIFLSRRQIDSIVYYLGSLLDKRNEFNSADVLMLESKLEALSDLP
jgi:hypothetical protein